MMMSYVKTLALDQTVEGMKFVFGYHILPPSGPNAFLNPLKDLPAALNFIGNCKTLVIFHSYLRDALYMLTRIKGLLRMKQEIRA